MPTQLGRVVFSQLNSDKFCFCLAAFYQGLKSNVGLAWTDSQRYNLNSYRVLLRPKSILE